MAKSHPYTGPIQRLIEALARLPGIGKRTAERLAFHILKSPAADAMDLADAVRQVRLELHHCSTCYNLAETDTCAICADPQRDRKKILIVEQPRDLASIESTGAYHGLYHVLLGHISPLEGIGAKDLTVEGLVARARKMASEGEGLELILGTNPNMTGDGTALVISQRLKDVPGLRLSRLGRGLPVGSQLEYVNKSVLCDALDARQAVE